VRLLLDTDVCIYLIKRKSAEILERLAQYEVGDVGLSSVTVAELSFGVGKSRQVERNREALQQFLLPFTVLSFDHQAAVAYGQVRADLERNGRPIGPLDTLIGAHALSLGVPLATNNVREFSRIDGLMVEGWGPPSSR